MTCNLASGSLKFTDRGNKGCIKLKLSVKSKLRVLFLSYLSCFLYLGYIIMLAEPIVEYESIATLGSASTRVLNDSAEDLAMAASSSAFGF